MYIGELSKRSTTSIKTIRYYEEIGLIKTPQREGKYRVYDSSYLQVLGMINLAKSLGFTLNELREIAQAKNHQGLVPMDLLKQKIESKRTKINDSIHELNQKLQGLSQLEQHVKEYNQCLLQTIE